ncbi:MAG: hypothetical protein R3F11_25815 [Verrucomicrobiales bacterium]
MARERERLRDEKRADARAGETEAELMEALDDLRADVTVLTLGQYLRPSLSTFRSSITSILRRSTGIVRSLWKRIPARRFRSLVRNSYHAADFKPELDPGGVVLLEGVVLFARSSRPNRAVEAVIFCPEIGAGDR